MRTCTHTRAVRNVDKTSEEIHEADARSVRNKEEILQNLTAAS